MPHAEPADRRLLLLVPLVLAAGAWGWVAQIGGGHEIVQWLTALGAPWLLVAFAAGALVRDRRVAVVAGALTLVAGVGAYYLSMLTVTDGALRYAARIGIAWGLVGVFAGPLFAWAGAVWRSGRGWPAAVAAAVPFAVLAGEVLALRREWWSPGARAALVLELAAAAVLLAALAPRDRRVVVTGVMGFVLAVLFAAAEVDVREALRAAGWAGA